MSAGCAAGIAVGVIAGLDQMISLAAGAGVGLVLAVLVMSSNKSFPETKEWNNEYLSSDIVLDIHDIQKYGQKLGNYVTRDTIQNGIHDLILSEKDSRDHVYRTVFDWLPGK